jgi:hypothetical protein
MFNYKIYTLSFLQLKYSVYSCVQFEGNFNIKPHFKSFK